MGIFTYNGVTIRKASLIISDAAVEEALDIIATSDRYGKYVEKFLPNGDLTFLGANDLYVLDGEVSEAQVSF